jgi:NAD(P)-dependent dehydrogenase (short-subunit alcohol dehydrogenase family)
MSDMNDKVALITGASSGIGRATGEAFAARGAKVVLAAGREHELATLTSEIESRGGRASFVVTDVAITNDVERMVAHAIETFGRLDYAVNNAGIEGKFAGIANLPEQEWDRVLRYRYYDSCPWRLCDPMTFLTQLVSWGSDRYFGRGKPFMQTTVRSASSGFAWTKPRFAVQRTSPFRTRLVLLSRGAFDSAGLDQ